MWIITPAGVVIASATQSGMLCVTRMNSIVNGPIVTTSRGLTVLSRSLRVDLVLVELRLDERERHRGAVDRAVEERQHVRHRADVILVAVRQHERLDLVAPRLDVGHVGNDQIDAELIGIREHDAGVDEDRGVLPRHRHHVHAELADAAQWDDLERRRSHVRHGGLIHSEPSVTAANLTVRPVSRSRERCPLAGRAVSRSSGRWEKTCKPGRLNDLRENYSTARERRAISSMVSASGRSRPSTSRALKEFGRRAAEGVGDGPKRVGERLPPLQKDAADDALEDAAVADVDCRRAETEAHDGGRHLRRRPEGAGWQREQLLDVCGQRDLDREHAVLLASRLRDQPVRDLLLEHQRRVGQEPPVVRGVRAGRTESATPRCTGGCRRPGAAARSPRSASTEIDVEEVRPGRRRRFWICSCCKQAAARSRSISIATTRPARVPPAAASARRGRARSRETCRPWLRGAHR